MLSTSEIIKWFKTMFAPPKNEQAVKAVEEAWRSFEERTTAAMHADPLFALAEEVYAEQTRDAGFYRPEDADDDPRLPLTVHYNVTWGVNVHFVIEQCTGFDCARALLEAWVLRGFKVTYMSDNTYMPSREFQMRFAGDDPRFEKVMVRVEARLVSDVTQRTCHLVGTGEYEVREKMKFDCPDSVQSINAKLGIE